MDISFGDEDPDLEESYIDFSSTRCSELPNGTLDDLQSTETAHKPIKSLKMSTLLSHDPKERAKAWAQDQLRNMNKGAI